MAPLVTAANVSRETSGELLYEYAPTARQSVAHATFADELLYGGSAGGGKLCWTMTPLLTTAGWKTQGTVRVGDYVYDHQGQPTEVLAVSDVETEPCYALRWSTGETIVAGERHLWVVQAEADRSSLARAHPDAQAARRATRPSRSLGEASKKPWLAEANARNNAARAEARRAVTALPNPWDYTRTLETADVHRLAARERKALTVPRPRAIQTPGEWELATAPWALGMWLGDGTTKSAIITHGEEDSDELVTNMKECGYPLTRRCGANFRNYEFGGLAAALRHDIGPAHTRTKRIPEAVYRAPYADRLAVAQGLVDSDGHVNARGQVEFCVTSRPLFQDAIRLFATLGIRVSQTSGPASYTLNGVRHVTGTRYGAKFSTEVPVARYARKLVRIKQDWVETNYAGRRSTIALKSITPTESVPMRCITIANPLGIYLLGDTLIPTHNSRYARAEAMAFLLEVPGAACVLFRRTFPDLSRAGGPIPAMLAEVPRGLGTYNAGDHAWTFRNGSTLELAHLGRDADVGKYQGAEYQLIVFEEATQFTEHQFRYLLSRLRASGAVRDELARRGLRPRVILTSNPGGIGHAWVKSRFIDPAPRGQVWRPEASPEDPRPGTRVFIPARVADNPHIDPSYVDRLNRLDADDRRALLEGDWGVYAGQRFRSFRLDVHVIDPEELPVPVGGVPRAWGVDYGLDAPFCALRGVRLADGLTVVTHELYGAGLTPGQQASAIVAAAPEGEFAPGRAAAPVALDPSTWARNPHADPKLKPLPGSDAAPPPGSIADAYRQRLPLVVKARNDRMAGVALVADKLRVRPDGLPRLLIYSTCRNLIRTLPALPRDPRHPEDVDTRAEDHAFDSLRYLLLELETAPLGPAEVRRRPAGSRPPSAGRPLRADTADLARQGF